MSYKYSARKVYLCHVVEIFCSCISVCLRNPSHFFINPSQFFIQGKWYHENYAMYVCKNTAKYKTDHALMNARNLICSTYSAKKSSSWAVTQHACLSAALWPCPSVCFNTLVCLILYLQQQSVLLVFDSWHVFFICALQWCHSGAVCQGKRPRSHFISCFLLLLLFLSLDRVD